MIDTPFKILLMMKRRGDMTVDGFRDYYENHHVPLVMRGASGMARYVRRYLEPQDHPETGPAGELPFDVITELWFEDEESFRATLEHLTTTVMPKSIVEDEARLFDRTSFRIATVVECDTPPRPS